MILLSVIGIGRVSAMAPADTVSVHFRQSHSQLDLCYSGNGERLDNLMGKISSKMSADSSLIVKSVHVQGGASPEGSEEINRTLSHRRAERIFDWLSSRVEIGDSVVDFTFLGRDWQGLFDIVRTDVNVPDREEVLDFIGNAIREENSGSSPHPDILTRFKTLSGGVPYHYLYSVVFPELRASRVIIDYGLRPSSFPAPELPNVTPPEIRLVPIMPVPALSVIEIDPASPNICRPFYMAVKTNLLSDALALPNIGAEFYIGKNWSVGADWTYGWWDRDATHHYWRAYGGELAVRRWFGRKAAEKPLTGHHLGLYAGVITYDFEFGGTGYMGGVPGGTLWNRCNWFGGVEYGYSLPVARRLNIDFTLGIGYLGGKYIKYVPKNGFYQWQSTNKLNWVGPTKAEISLVWLIGCDNFNRGKGGGK